MHTDLHEMTARPTALKAGSLGTIGVAFLIVSAAAPLGYLAGYGPLALLIGGAGAASGFIAGGVVLMFFLAAFTAMTPYVKNSGAFYAYVTAGLGRPAGTVSAVVAVVAYNLALIGALGAIATYLGPHLSNLVGHDVPWGVTAILATVVVFAVAACGIDLGAKFLGILLGLETALIMIVVGAILVKGGHDGLSLETFSPSFATAPGMGAVLALTFVGFLGIEGAALYRSESRNPDRTIPRAAYLAVGTMALFYAFVTWAVVQAFGTDGVVPAATDNGAQLFFVAADQYVGSWAVHAMDALIITSLLAAQLAFHNAANRYAYSLARDGLFPRMLAITSKGTSAPWVAGLVATVVSVIGIALALALGWDPYFEMSVWLLSVAAVLILLLQLATCVAVAAFFARRHDLAGRTRGMVCAVIAAVLLGIVGYRLLSQFDLLTANGPKVNATILGILGGFVVLTVVVVAAVATWRPAALAHIGEEQHDGTP